MKTKRTEQFIKNYFYFNRQERKGVLALIILLLAVVVIPKLYVASGSDKPPKFDISPIAVAEEHGPDEASIQQPGELFPFDPNTADDSELKTLGFSEKNIATIRNFQKKGGRFNKAGDLRKLYGIDSEKLALLLPFVTLSGTPKGFRDTSFKRSRPAYPIELNTADSSSLVALYRIGPGLAHRIIEYRNQLGGFISLQQLTDLWGFDEDILYDLKGKITVNPALARKFELNHSGAEELRTHPYFKYKLSDAIVNYRRQHGSYSSLEDLKKLVQVNDSVYRRIRLYLYLDEQQP